MKREFADRYGEYQRSHWWFRGRSKILKSLLSREALSQSPNILEIGAGSGQTLYTVYPEHARLVGIEPDAELLRVAQSRGDVPVYEGCAENLPEQVRGRQYDVIALWDVLEHIKEDGQILNELRKLLKPGGVIVLSVPAFMWLWGTHDDINMHYRRYTVTSLRTVFQHAGMCISYYTYFNFFLLPPIAIFRRFHRASHNTAGSCSDFEYSSGILNFFLGLLFASERFFLKLFRCPIGVSLYAVGQVNAELSEKSV